MSMLIRKRKTDTENGFTLMEVLIAIAILAIVLSTVYESFVQTRKAIGKTEASIEELRGVRAAFSRIMQDISMAFLVKENDSTFFTGKDDSSEGYPSDSIDFTSYANRIRNKDAKESDQAEIGYYLKRGNEGGSVLMKRVKKRIDTNPGYGGDSFEITEDIVGLNFRYLDNDAWVDSWDSSVNKTIPQAVEITIIVKDSSGNERTFKGIAEIPLGKVSSNP
ncbi:MAG: type II secretion system protein GspJ [Nitrospira sp.]|nr:type II secretion system protein GspJ [Nitrospira sp.]